MKILLIILIILPIMASDIDDEKEFLHYGIYALQKLSDNDIIGLVSEVNEKVWLERRVHEIDGKCVKAWGIIENGQWYTIKKYLEMKYNIKVKD